MNDFEARLRELVLAEAAAKARKAKAEADYAELVLETAKRSAAAMALPSVSVARGGVS